MNSVNLQNDVTVHHQDGCVVIRVDGSMTVVNAEAIDERMAGVWGKDTVCDSLILDLGDVRRMDSSWVREVMARPHRAKKAGIPLKLCCLQDAPPELSSDREV